jgi:hypothetical protein
MALGEILGSALLAAIVTAYATRAHTERTIYADNITKERAKWRERIRKIISHYPDASENERSTMRRELVTRLNPFHAEDLKLIEALKNANSSNDTEISIRASLLLKHDWERAKEEAKPFWNRRIRPLHRVTFEEYMNNYKLFVNGSSDSFEKNLRRITEDEPLC